MWKTSWNRGFLLVFALILGSRAAPWGYQPPGTGQSTQYNTNLTQILNQTSTPSSGFAGQSANVFAGDKLPDGKLIKDLPDKFGIYAGKDQWSRIVANNQKVYVISPVQSRKDHYVYDPWTIGQVLGYIYESAEFGAAGPPGGFTIELMGKNKPVRWSKRSIRRRKYRQGEMIFIKKN